MGLQSDFFVADADQASGYPETRPARSDIVAFGGLTVQEVSELWTVLQNASPHDNHLNAFACVREDQDGALFVHRLPEPFVAMLAGLDDASAQAAAEQWVRVGELAYMNASPDDARRIIDGASRLARMTQSTPGKALYFCASM
jgi:hypothetical protein